MRRAAVSSGQPRHAPSSSPIAASGTARKTKVGVPVKSMPDLQQLRMKKTTVLLLLLTAFLMDGVLPPGAGAQTSASSQARSLRKAEKRRQKATKKYAKAQKKAEHKMLKTERKNTKYPSDPSL
jgi:hypothetical protein